MTGWIIFGLVNLFFLLSALRVLIGSQNNFD